MAVSVAKLIYDTELKVNAVDSDRANDYKVIDYVSIINWSFEKIIEFLILSKDQNETLRNHLRPLMRTKDDFVIDNDSKFSSIEYPSDFYEISDIRVVVSCNECDGITKELVITKPQGDDLGYARNNPHRRADFYFEQLPAFEYEKGLRFFHEGLLKIDSIILNYYKKINRLEAPSLVSELNMKYSDWDGNIITSDVNFEIDSTYLNNSVTDLAAFYILNSSKDFVSANQKIKEILQTNQFYK